MPREGDRQSLRLIPSRGGNHASPPKDLECLNRQLSLEVVYALSRFDADAELAPSSSLEARAFAAGTWHRGNGRLRLPRALVQQRAMQHSDNRHTAALDPIKSAMMSQEERGAGDIGNYA